MSLNKKVVLGLLFFVIICGIWWFVHCGSKVRLTRSETLVIGTSSGFPPYEVLDDHGNLVGFDIDVAHVLAKQLNKKLVLKDMSFDALVLALKQGSIDIALAGISITDAKLKEIALVPYQGEAFTYIPLLFWQKIPDGVTTITDIKKLANKMVAIQAGTIEEEFLSHYDFLMLKSLENVADLIMDIKYGKSLAFCVDPAVAQSLMQQVHELHMLKVPLKDNEKAHGQGIGIAKTNTTLIANVKNVVSELKQQGIITALENKWFQKGVSHVVS
jgi:ABC-type amino acid transport substrate-binding protein